MISERTAASITTIILFAFNAEAWMNQWLNCLKSVLSRNLGLRFTIIVLISTGITKQLQCKERQCQLNRITAPASVCSACVGKPIEAGAFLFIHCLFTYCTRNIFSFIRLSIWGIVMIISAEMVWELLFLIVFLIGTLCLFGGYHWFNNICLLRLIPTKLQKGHR